MDFNKLITILIFILSINLSAQDTPGNLQFNKVINLEYTEVLDGTTSSFGDNGDNLLETLTVPENKVWKIISASITLGDNSREDNPLYLSHGSNIINLFIGGTKIMHNGNNSNDQIRLPIWISSGTRNLTAYMAGSTNEPWWFSISIIEFNIVN
tara:strand:+ start:4091 stop:4552 length:462 start_codon:yes stop_codon:yes gene_type:complete